MNLQKAVQICSMFCEESEPDEEGIVANSAMEFVRLRPQDASGTNGHILAIIPTETKVDTERFVDRWVGEVKPDLRFPDTEKCIEKIRAVEPTVTLHVDAGYLRRVIEAFQSASDSPTYTAITVTVRGPMDAIEFTNGEMTAWLMPRKKR